MKNLIVTITNVKLDLNNVKNEYEKGGYQSVLVHLYSGIVDSKLLSWVAQRIAQELPDAKIVGTLSAGEIKNGRIVEECILASVMMFEHTEVSVFTYENVNGNEKQVGQEACSDINGIANVKTVELMMPGTNFDTWTIFDGLNHLEKGIQVFGGYSGGHSLDIKEHFVFDAKGVYDNAMFAIAYAGEDFHVSVDKAVGWQRIGMPFRITKADGNRIIEINNEPAVSVYEKYLSIARDSDTFVEDTFEFPLMILKDGDELLRHTASVEADGSLMLAGYVKEGMEVVLSFGNPTMIVSDINKRLAELNRFHPQGILLYSCMVRKSFWENFVDMETLPFQKLAPTVGFHTWGEIKRNEKTSKVLEYNITLLSIAMKEGEGEQKTMDEVTVNGDVLKGQASLMKRLTQLVVATTKELYKLNARLVEVNEHDKLTGLYNRGKIEALILQELERKGPTALVMLDIDHFKHVNDTYGHGAGDAVLCGVSRLMQAAAREADAAAGRWGGEEFFILLPHTDKEGAMAFAEKLRVSIARESFEEVGNVTASLGVVVSEGNPDTKQLFIDVDNALYQAKNTGRNKVVGV